MAATIYGELTADTEQIVLLATGADHDVASAARQLRFLTPTVRKSDPPGALVLPTSWPAIVQLSNTFGSAWRPGPRLVGWIEQQVHTRTDGPVQLLVEHPDHLTPYEWQVANALTIATTGRVLVGDEPGCVYGDALMTVNRGGRSFTIKLRELVRRLNGGRGSNRWGSDRGIKWDLSIPTCIQREADDGTIRLARITGAWESGVKQTYTVITETGRTIRATDEHPFLTEHGWLRLDELKPGDQLHVRGAQATGGPTVTKKYYREVAGLPAHPHARGANRRTSRYRVAYHRLVVEAAMNGLDYEVYIKRLRDGDVAGLMFLDPAVWAVHHLDHNHEHNEQDNLAVLTHSAHHRPHAHEGKSRAVLYKAVSESVVSIEPYGQEETFDIEVADDPHNFVADGFVVHNTGKTASAILGVVERGFKTCLVVCPASVVDSWVDAWREWAPGFKTVAWRGSRSKRRALAGQADVFVTSYDTARMDAQGRGSDGDRALERLGADALILDEHHYAKNPMAERTRCVRRLAQGTRSFVALSGTPISHHPGDLHPVLAMLAPGAWPSRERWINRYCLVARGDYSDEVLGLDPGREPEFRTTLLGQHRRVSKADVLSQLPSKVYSVRTVELPSTWRKAYDDMESKMLAELPDGSALTVMSVLAQLTRLSQLASAAADVTVTKEIDADGVERDHFNVKLKNPSWKVAALIEVLDERPGQPVVTFAPSRQLMMLAGQAAEKSGRSVGYIVGGQTAAERTNTIAAFQDGKLDLLCATTQAGGVGITLTAARTACFLQRPWSYAEALQAEDRLHRIGSERHDSIEIVDVVAKNTIDTRVRSVLREKAGQLADLVQDKRIVTELLGGANVRRSR